MAFFAQNTTVGTPSVSAVPRFLTAEAGKASEVATILEQKLAADASEPAPIQFLGSLSFAGRGNDGQFAAVLAGLPGNDGNTVGQVDGNGNFPIDVFNNATRIVGVDAGSAEEAAEKLADAIGVAQNADGTLTVYYTEIVGTGNAGQWGAFAFLHIDGSVP